jgi:hypothetical protein
MADLEVVYECPRCGAKTIGMGVAVRKVCFCFGSEKQMVPKRQAERSSED